MMSVNKPVNTTFAHLLALSAKSHTKEAEQKALSNLSSADSFHGLTKKCGCIHGCDSCSPMLTSDAVHPAFKKEIKDAPSFNPSELLTPEHSNPDTPDPKFNPFESSDHSLEASSPFQLNSPPQSPEVPVREELPLSPTDSSAENVSESSKKRKRDSEDTGKKELKVILDKKGNPVTEPGERRRIQNRVAQTNFRNKAKLAKETAEREAEQKRLADEEAKNRQLEHSRYVTSFADSIFKPDW